VNRFAVRFDTMFVDRKKCGLKSHEELHLQYIRELRAHCKYLGKMPFVDFLEAWTNQPLQK
jgi:hypothetical protein